MFPLPYPCSSLASSHTPMCSHNCDVVLLGDLVLRVLVVRTVFLRVCSHLLWLRSSVFCCSLCACHTHSTAVCSFCSFCCFCCAWSHHYHHLCLNNRGNKTVTYLHQVALKCYHIDATGCSGAPFTATNVALFYVLCYAAVFSTRLFIGMCCYFARDVCPSTAQSCVMVVDWDIGVLGRKWIWTNASAINICTHIDQSHFWLFLVLQYCKHACLLHILGAMTFIYCCISDQYPIT